MSSKSTDIMQISHHRYLANKHLCLILLIKSVIFHFDGSTIEAVRGTILPRTVIVTNYYHHHLMKNSATAEFTNGVRANRKCLKAEGTTASPPGQYGSAH